MAGRGLVWAAVMVLAGTTASLATDVVVLKSGTMMEGEVVSLDASEVVLTIESGKSILDRSNVRSIHFDTTIGELRRPTAPDAEPDRAPAPAKDDDRVFSPHDKEAFALGDAVEAGSLRLRLADATIRRVRVVDLLGGVKESRDEFLVLRFEAANVGDGRDLEVSGDPAFGAPLLRVEDEKGNRISGKSFGAGSHVEGELRDGEKIVRGDEKEDLEVFELPGAGVKALVVRVNLERFGGKGMVTWRLERGEVE